MKLITKITDTCKEARRASWTMKISTYLKANHSDDEIVMKYADPKTCGTFRQLEKCLKEGKSIFERNVYDIIGIGDSVVREYAFEGLANLMGVDYDDIYKMWIA